MKKLITFFSLLFIFQLKISAQVVANAGSDLEICLYDTLKLTGSGLPVGDSGSYKWYQLKSNTLVSTNEFYKKRVLSALPDSFRLLVTRIKNGITYIDDDTIAIHVNPLPTFAYGGLSNFCFSDCNYNLTKNLYAIGRAGYDASEKDSSLVYYKNNKKDWLVKTNDEYIYSFCNYINNSEIPSNGIRDTICFEYRDSKGCYNKACRSFRINPNPIVEMINATICIKQGQFNLDNLVVKPFVKTGGISTFRCLSVPSTSSLDKNNIISTVQTVPATHYLNLGAIDTLNVGDYVIEYGFKNSFTGCETLDTATITIVGLPELKFKSFPKFCINHDAIDLDTMVYDARTGKALHGIWTSVEYNGSRDQSNPNVKIKLDSSIVQNRFRSQFGAGSYYIKFVEQSSVCGIMDSIPVVVNGLPLVQIDVQDTVCVTDSVVPLSNIVPVGNVGIWSGLGVKGNSFDARFSPQKNEFERMPVKYTYTNPTTLCTSSDSQDIYVKTLVSFKINSQVTRTNSTFHMAFYLSNVQFAGSNVNSLIWRFSDNTADSSLGFMGVAYKTTQDSGIYKAYVTITDGFCQSTDSLEVDLNYTIKDSKIDNSKYDGLTFYPNPANESIQLSILDAGELVIADYTGKVIMKLDLEAGSHKIDVRDLSKGLYILSYVNSYGQTIQYKVIKE